MPASQPRSPEFEFDDLPSISFAPDSTARPTKEQSDNVPVTRPAAAAVARDQIQSTTSAPLSAASVASTPHPPTRQLATSANTDQLSSAEPAAVAATPAPSTQLARTASLDNFQAEPNRPNAGADGQAEPPSAHARAATEKQASAMTELAVKADLRTSPTPARQPFPLSEDAPQQSSSDSLAETLANRMNAVQTQAPLSLDPSSTLETESGADKTEHTPSPPRRRTTRSVTRSPRRRTASKQNGTHSIAATEATAITQKSGVEPHNTSAPPPVTGAERPTDPAARSVSEPVLPNPSEPAAAPPDSPSSLSE